MRIEKDILGEIEIDNSLYYGINTVRALSNFGLSSSSFDGDFLVSYFYVKKACTLTNKDLGYIDNDIADSIIKACDFFINCDNLISFIPINPFMGGAGTSLNMNINEILANKALELMEKSKGDYHIINPLDHVNMYQSTNDTFPTALRVAILFKLKNLVGNVERLQGILQKKEREFEDVLKIGRTELQDATPITLGKEFSAFADAIGRDRWRIFKCEERIKSVNLGGTTIGTGLAAPRDYIFSVTDNLRDLTNLPIARADNLVDATANSDSFVEISGILNAHAVNLSKMCNDLRLMNLLKDIKLPAKQQGSSIMPTKVNPVICEFAIQAYMKIKANDGLINDASSRATFQINEFLPMLSFAILESLSLLINVDEKLIDYISGVKPASNNNFDNSRMIATAIIPYIGYKRVEELINKFDKTEDKHSFIDFLKYELGDDFIDENINSFSITRLGMKK